MPGIYTLRYMPGTYTLRAYNDMSWYLVGSPNMGLEPNVCSTAIKPIMDIHAM